jgi:hypothetical protein
MKPKIKPRNPFVALTKFRKAGSHEKPAKSLRRHEKQTLAKTAMQSPESWHKGISPECSTAMTPASAHVFLECIACSQQPLLWPWRG